MTPTDLEAAARRIGTQLAIGTSMMKQDGRREKIAGRRSGNRQPMLANAKRDRMVRGHMVERRGTMFIFECPAGHRSQRDYGKGPRHRRMAPALLEKFSRYWSREGGGVSYECRRCL